MRNDKLSLGSFPMAQLRSALLDNWVPAAVPVAHIKRGLASSDISSQASVLLGSDWTLIGSTDVRVSGGRPLILGAQLSSVTVPAGTTAAFAFGWNSTSAVAYVSALNGQATLTTSGGLTLSDVLNEGPRTGTYTVALLGRSIGTGSATVNLAGSSAFGKVWAYEF